MRCACKSKVNDMPENYIITGIIVEIVIVLIAAVITSFDKDYDEPDEI